MIFIIKGLIEIKKSYFCATFFMIIQMKVKNFLYKDKETFQEALLASEIFSRIEKSQTILLQVFCGIPEEDFIKTLIKDLKELLPQAKIIGTTTAGEIFNMSVEEESVVVSVSLFEHTDIQTAVYEKTESPTEYQLGRKIAREMIQDKTKGLLVFPDGLFMDIDKMLKGIESINNKVRVFGGAAGDNGKFKKTFVFNEEKVSGSGVSVAAFNSEKLHIYSGYKLNWRPVGKTMKVTKAEGKMVYEIDGMSPKDVYRKYLGEKLASMGENTLATAFPLLLLDKEFLIARAVLSGDEDGAMLFAGNVEEGSKVRLSYGYLPDMLGETEKTFNEIKQHPAEAIYIYSCIARKHFLGAYAPLETSPLYGIAPIAGFFTYGEIYQNQGKNVLLNDTMTFVVMSESSELPQAEYKPAKQFENQHLLLLEGLTHLANAVTSELEAILNELEHRKNELLQINEELMQTNEELLAKTEEVERVRRMLEEQNLNIKQSISYAERIQEKILPDISSLKQYMDFGFIYFPKDKLSGDFYWYYTHKDFLYFAVVDCTGHGIPGAMISMLGYAFLNRILLNFQEKSPTPAQVLTALNKEIFSVFSKQEHQQDGMDIILGRFDRNSSQILFSGARRPFWILNGEQIYEFPTAKVSIGEIETPEFKNYAVKRNQWEQIYMFTDGITDQIGGNPPKKLGKKKLKEHLLSVKNLPVHNQIRSLKKLIIDLKKNAPGGEQTDDITFFTFKNTELEKLW